MISAGSARASSSARAVLPAAVGPISRIALAVSEDGLSAATQEKLVQLGNAQLRPGRPAVIALVRAIRLLHVPEQCIHFRAGELPVRAHRPVTGHRAEQLVDTLFQPAAAALLRQ